MDNDMQHVAPKALYYTVVKWLILVLWLAFPNYERKHTFAFRVLQ